MLLLVVLNVFTCHLMSTRMHVQEVTPDDGLTDADMLDPSEGKSLTSNHVDHDGSVISCFTLLAINVS